MPVSDNIWKAIRFERPATIPVRVSVLPAVWIKYREELDRIFSRYPGLFENQYTSPADYDQVASKTYHEGEHTDAWGCVWSNIKHGMEAIVTRHPVPEREQVWQLKPPVEDIGFPHGFMFLRLCDLRGFEEAMIDFAEEPPELQRLIEVVLDYNLRQADLLLKKLPAPELVGFGDDLGMQTSLPTGPEKWRQYLKPCYQKIYAPFKAAGHTVYMHTDGHIHEIIPDLIDCGVSVINPQIRANGLDNLVRVCKGKLCVALDLDRQMFPFGTPADIDDHVREAVEKLGSPAGGLWLVAEISQDIPLENIDAICQALDKYRLRFS